MEITQSATHLTISLSRWEKLASLHGDVNIPLQDVTAASVDRDPTGSVFGKLKRGLRIPGFLYLATADRGQHFIAVRRGEPALHLQVRGTPHEVTVSSPDAERIAESLSGSPA